MLSKEITKGILSAVGALFGILILGWFLFKIQSVVLYIIIAAVISLIGRPIILFFKNRLRFNNLLAVISTMLLFFGFFIGLLLLFIPLIRQQSQNLSLLNIDSLSKTIENLYTEML